MKESSLTLPLVSQTSLGVRPHHRSDEKRRFMNPGEIEVLVALMHRVTPETVIEIGVNEGLTAATLLHEVTTIKRYIGIDVPFGHVATCHAQREETPRHPGQLALDDSRFSCVLRPRGSLDFRPGSLPFCEAMFIDGDHSAEGVTHDARLAAKAVKPGGVIIYHDYHDLGNVDVREVLHELVADGHQIFHAEGTWLAFEWVR